MLVRAPADEDVTGDVTRSHRQSQTAKKTGQILRAIALRTVGVLARINGS